MPPDLRTYLKLVRAGFSRQANYRLAMLAGLVTNLVFGFIRAAILFAAVSSAGGSLGGYTTGTISSYVWLSQGLLGAIELSGRAEIGDRVRTGDVAIDFTRPVDLQTWHLAEDLGRAAYTLIPRGVPSVLIGALTVGLVMPDTVLPYVMGVVEHRRRGRHLLLRQVCRQHPRLLADGHPRRSDPLHGDRAASWPGCTCRSGCSRDGCTRWPTARRSLRSCRRRSTSSPARSSGSMPRWT